MLRHASKQSGFAPLFVLIPIIVAITIAATLSIPKIISNRNQSANIFEQIEQKEKELEELRIASTSQSQDALAQELLALKKELDALKNTPQNKPSVTKQTTPTPKLTPTPAQISLENNLRIEISSSRNNMPADGEAIAFINAEVRDQNNKLVGTFSGEIEFQTTAGVLLPTRVTAKNGMAYTELRASTAPTNLTVSAKSGNINSNSINLSFTQVVNNSQQNQNYESPITSSDVQAVPKLICDQNKNASGSGVIFTNDGWLLTNDHVAGNSTDCEVWVSFDDKQPPRHVYTAYVVGSNVELDAAILKINRDAYGNYLQNRNFNFLRQSYENIEIGQDIRALGFPGVGGSTITVTKGIVGGWSGNFIKTDLLINRGNSGGPVIDKEKGIVGVVSFKRISNPNNPDDAKDILFYFIDITKIADWWKKRVGFWPY